MNCPVCGENLNGNEEYCTGCGANVASFANVPKEKIILNQSVSEQLESGDDSATIMLDPSEANTYTNTNTVPPAFAQQQPNTQQNGFVYNNMQQMVTPGIAPQQNMYQNNYAMAGYGGKKKNFVSALITLIATSIAVIVNAILSTNALFYVMQSYTGGKYSDSFIRNEIRNDKDMVECEKVFSIIFMVATVLIILALINQLFAFLKIKAGCIKSPVSNSVGGFVFSILGSAIAIGMNAFFKKSFEEEYSSLSGELREAAKFNIYNMAVILGVIIIIASFINIIVSIREKRK